jgi:hypothetical protein
LLAARCATEAVLLPEQRGVQPTCLRAARTCDRRGAPALDRRADTPAARRGASGSRRRADACFCARAQALYMRKRPQDGKAIHVMSSGLKAGATWSRVEILQVCSPRRPAPRRPCSPCRRALPGMLCARRCPAHTRALRRSGAGWRGVPRPATRLPGVRHACSTWARRAREAACGRWALVRQACREACGGQGFLAANKIGPLKSDMDVDVTFEGDNTVMMQQARNPVQARVRCAPGRVAMQQRRDCVPSRGRMQQRRAWLLGGQHGGRSDVQGWRRG